MGQGREWVDGEQLTAQTMPCLLVQVKKEEGSKAESAGLFLDEAVHGADRRVRRSVGDA